MAGEMASAMAFVFSGTIAMENAPVMIAAAMSVVSDVSSEMGSSGNRGFVGLASTAAGRVSVGTAGSSSRGNVGTAGAVLA